MKSKELKDYIERVYELESSLYNQRLVMDKIKGGIRFYKNIQYEREINLKSGYSDEKIVSGLTACGFISIFVGPVICFLLALINILEFTLSSIVGSICIVFIICMIPTLGDILSKEKEVDEENDRILLYNEELNEKNTILKEQNMQRIGLLNKELDRRQIIYNQTLEILNEYYSKDIIYVKYRDLVPVSSFYEYLCSGRCNCLEGHEGAYNIFENEIRADRIIEKLDIVISKLDSIERNQRMLYLAICEGNNKADKLLKKVSQTVNSLQRLEDNTSLIAYNNEIVAQNTEFIKWFEIYR